MSKVYNDKLPKNWLDIQLSEVGIWGSGGTPLKENTAYYNGKIPWLKIGDLNDGYIYNAEENITELGLKNSSAKLLEPETILLAMYGSIGKLGITKIPCATNQAIAFCKPYTELILLKYLFYGLMFLKDKFISQGQGGTQKNISQAIIKTERLSLAPIREQKRIVSKIEELFSDLDKAESALKRTQKLLEQYKQAVLKAAVTGELTKEWREQNKDSLESGKALLETILKKTHKFDKIFSLEKDDVKIKKLKNVKLENEYSIKKYINSSELPGIPQSWTWATLNLLGDFGRGKSKHRPRNDPILYSNGRYPFLQTGTVRNSKGRINKYDKLYNDVGLKQSRLWPKGTICITIAANIAESGILGFDACFPDSIVGLIPDENISGEFIEFFIRTAKEHLYKFAPATAQKNINLDILSKVAIPLPPYSEQVIIYEEVQKSLCSATKIEDQINYELIKLNKLRQSILKTAFSGHLVPQDPNDEPAEELLKRIQAEKAIKQPKQKTKPSAKKAKQFALELSNE